MIGDPDVSIGSPNDRAHRDEIDIATRRVEFASALNGLIHDFTEQFGVGRDYVAALLTMRAEELQAKLHCMCGDPVDHSPWSGHSPVSMFDHAVSQEVGRIRETLAPFAVLGGPLNMAGKEAIPDGESARYLKLDGIEAQHFRDAHAAFTGKPAQ